jgi:putative membrane protein
MANLKHVFRGILVSSTVFGMLTLGAFAQDQSSSASSTSKKSHKASNAATASDTSSNSSSSQLSASDKQFVMKAAQGGLAEVQLGQLAAQNGNSDRVKQFGQRMVDDHTKANDQLKQIAEQKGVTIPTDLSAKDKAQKDQLSKLKGDAFDRAYMKHMVMDHKKDVAEFQKEANSGKDNDIKNFASQTLPTLQDHLKEAQQVQQAEMKEGTKQGSTTASANPKQ